MFNFLNRRYYNDEVPHTTSVTWAPLNGDNGDYQDGAIRIDTTLQGSPRLVKIIMLHEMIHARYPRLTHGKKFRAELKRLFDLGAYSKLL
jgi:hypothetical protein